MKIEVNEEPKTVEKPFPKLMKGASGVIIYAQSSHKSYIVGTQLSEHTNQQGKWSETWNKNHFTDFIGSITLSND